MGKTRRHERPPGDEYWGRRPRSRKHGATPGRLTKDLTHRAERREAEIEIRQVLDERAAEEERIRREEYEDYLAYLDWQDNGEITFRVCPNCLFTLEL